MANYLTKPMVDRLYSAMKEKGINTSYILKLLNVNFKQWEQALKGDIQFYNKWSNKIATALETDRQTLFPEFFDSSNLRSRLIKFDESECSKMSSRALKIEPTEGRTNEI